LVTTDVTHVDAANIVGTIDNTSLPQTIDIEGGFSANTVTAHETVTANRIVSNILTTDQIVVNTDSGEGILDANLIKGQLDGDIVFLDGHLEMTTLSADDITLAGNSLLAEISLIKNTNLSSFTVQDGSAAAPSVAFQSDSDTGLFRPGGDTVALAAGGVASLEANATHVTMGNVVATTVSATDVLINGNSATTLRTDTWLQSTDGQDRVFYDTNGNTQFAGTVEANAFVGDGQFLSNVATSNASSLTTGTLANARLPQDITITGDLTANAIYGNLDLANQSVDGELVLLDGYLSTTTISADDITLAGNSLVAEIAAIKNTDLSSFTVQDGTASAPSLAFQSDTNTGLFRPGSDTVALAAGGATALEANATHVTMGNVVATTVSATDVLINGNSATTLRTDTWLQSTDGQDRVYYDTNGNTQFAGTVEANAFVGDGQFLSNVATSNASSLTTGTLANARLPQDITITGDLTANAIYGNLDLTNQSVDGELVLLDGHLSTTTISADDITLAGNSLVAEIAAIKNTDLSSFTVQDGSAAAPSLAFQSDSNTGLFRAGTDTVALAAGGVAALEANATHITANNVVATTVSATDVLINGNSATTLRTDTWLQSSDGQDRVFYVASGNTQFSGTVEANAFVGDGQLLSNVATTDASTLTSGTLDNARLPQTITISGDLTANAVYGNLDLTNQTVDGELTVLDTLVVDTDVVINGNSVETRLADLESRLAALEA
jgi:uncharacterized protein (DUF1778 family)